MSRLAVQAPPSTAIVCLQNGVNNEVEALRCFASVWGVNVGCPATHPAPGTVYSYAAPGPGRLEIGRWNPGPDRLSAELAVQWRRGGFDAIVSPGIRPAKYGKLLHNLPNAIDALCGRSARASRLAEDVEAEGKACLDAAGIGYLARDEQARRAAEARFARIDGESFPGGSTAQSLERGTSVESDYLNGEISLIGRLHGVRTPLNSGLQRLMTRVAASGTGSPRLTVDQLSDHLLQEGACP